MKKSQAELTTAKNLEDKFDRGEDVLEYFDVRRAKVTTPKSSRSFASATSAGSHAIKQNSNPRAIVREKSGAYRKRSARKSGKK